MRPAASAASRIESTPQAIMAAVVGVILNLSVWFAVHTIFHTADARTYGPLRIDVPAWSSLNLAALVLGMGALVAMLRFKVGMGWTLFGSAVLGVAWTYLHGA